MNPGASNAPAGRRVCGQQSGNSPHGASPRDAPLPRSGRLCLACKRAAVENPLRQDGVFTGSHGMISKRTHRLCLVRADTETQPFRSNPSWATVELRAWRDRRFGCPKQQTWKNRYTGRPKRKQHGSLDHPGRQTHRWLGSNPRRQKRRLLPQIAGSLLGNGRLQLLNVPDVTDVDTMLALMAEFGVVATRERGKILTLDASRARNAQASYDLVRRMRAGILVLAPLLARFGSAHVSLPGGCAIGARPVDLHLKALEALGAKVAIEGGYIKANAGDRLSGGRIVLASPSVGATETALLAAALARGETEILNSARDPEACDLALCLIAMGARIEGAGTHRILVQGVDSLRPASHQLMPTVLRRAPMPSPPPSQEGISRFSAPISSISDRSARRLSGGRSDLADRPRPDGLRPGPLELGRYLDRALSRISRPTCRRNSWR